MDTSITNLRALVNFSAETYGIRDAFRYLEQGEVHTKSYLDLQRDTRRLGRALDAHGLAKQHVALVGPTSYQWIATYLGTVNSGGVVVPLDAQLAPADLCELIARSDAAVFAYDQLFAPLVDTVRIACPKVKLFLNLQQPQEGCECFDAFLDAHPAECAPQLDETAVAAILFTSGTTGKSKGVMLSHKNLADNALCMPVPYQSEQDVILSVLPIHHAYCFTCDILQGLHVGVPICINDSLMHLTKNLSRFSPTLMLLVPMIVESIYRQLGGAAKAKNLPIAAVAQAVFGGRLRVIYSGGAYLDPALIAQYHALGIRLLQGYGMTECAPRISANTEERNKDGSVGPLVNGCTVKIVEHEIWAKSDSVMLGYYQDPQNTAETLQDGWLKTGDLGYLDEESYLFLTGRKKNLIILSNGENISPEELENTLSTLALVREVLVYEKAGGLFAEIFPDADVAKEMGVSDLRGALEAELDKINLNYPPYKRIRGMELRETEFDKTPSKKIKRKYAQS